MPNKLNDWVYLALMSFGYALVGAHIVQMFITFDLPTMIWNWEDKDRGLFIPFWMATAFLCDCFEDELL